MRTIYKITIIVFLASNLFGCKNDMKTSSEETVKTTIPETSKNEKKEETNKSTIVSVDAIIGNKKFTLDTIDFKKSGEVVYLNDGLQFRFIDVRGYEVLVNLFSSEIHETTPITFSQQVSALDVKEQASTKTKRSRLEFVIPTEQRLVSDSKIFYSGNVFLKKFTDAASIVISFKGKGFTRNYNPGSSSFEDKLFPMEGKIIVENFKIYDGRF